MRDRPRARSRAAWRRAAPSPRRACVDDVEAELAACALPEGPRVQGLEPARSSTRQPRRRPGWRSPARRTAERSRPWLQVGQRAADGAPESAAGRLAATVAGSVKRESAQAGTSCRQRTSGSSAVASSHHLVEKRDAAAAASCCRGTGSRCGRAPVYATDVRVLLADPPAFTPWYDHELAAALAPGRRRRRARHVAFSVRQPSRRPTATAASEAFYPLSSRLFRRSRLRLPLKAVEHLDVLRAPRPRRCRTCCTCSGSRCRRPTCACGFRVRRPCSPRTTCCRAARRRRAISGGGCSAKFDRVVVHSERGRETLGELGIDARVIPHPVYPSAATRARRRADAALARA